MTKGKKGKKKNLKLRRQIRKTMGALLMVSAIVVAAIPVPDIAAAPDDELQADSFNDVRASIDYPLNAADDAKGTSVSLPRLEGEDEEDEYDGYSVVQLSGGSWSFNRLYKCYTTLYQGTYYAVISKYIGVYPQDVLEIGNSVNSEYLTIEQDEFDAFWKKDEENNYIELDYDHWRSHYDSLDTSLGNPATWFYKYSRETYDSYGRLCLAYDSALSAWDRLPDEEKTDANKPQKPDSQRYIPADVIRAQGEEAMKTYYCNRYADGKLEGYGFTLESVRDNTDQDGSNVASHKYMMKRDPSLGPLGRNDFFVDNNGFLSTEDSLEIIGIGEKAFENVANVTRLNAPEEIRFICDEAFKNSFIGSVTFKNAEKIGNRAFMDCTSLTNVTLEKATKDIGAEAFRNSGISSIKFPSTVEELGTGAFAYCSNLRTVEFTAPGTDCMVGDYAFFNDTALDSVEMEEARIISIGTGAFAISSVQTGGWQNAVLPNFITGEDDYHKLGDLLFAGRNDLRSVKFPRDYGRDKSVSLDSGMFKDCVSLEYVDFHSGTGSSACVNVSYPPELFLDVLNPLFEVRGPERTRSGSEAYPRVSTWKAFTKVTNYVPYVYFDNSGARCYEISDGEYIMQANDRNQLTSCRPVDEDSDELIDLVIPEKIGSYDIKAIADGAVSNENLRNRLRSITIKDNSITELNDSVFEGLPYLQEVEIGNSVAAIGSRVFANCPRLVEVTFHTPSAGYENFTIGENAFKTGSQKLTMNGDIVPGYAPFDFAVGKDSGILDDVTGKRICYKSLAPSFLTVMYDDSADEVVLLDYPRFNDIDNQHEAYCKYMENFYYDKYGGLQGSYTVTTTTTRIGEDGKEITETSSYVAMTGKVGTETSPDGNVKRVTKYNGDSVYDKYREEFTKLLNDPNADAYASPYFGPWIDSTYKDLVNASNVGDNYFGVTIADSTVPRLYFDGKGYSILDNYNRGNNATMDYESLTSDERAWIDNCLNIVIPAGVTSIDAKRYFESKDNNINVTTYFDGNIIRDKCMSNSTNDAEPGLFSGYWEDYEGTSAYETETRGNDRILSITMTDVKYLPDYAFDSCERLQRVTLGAALSQMGKAPFRGCYSAVDVAGNDYFDIENGIIYIVNDGKDGETEAGTYTIKECLPARGKEVGEPVIMAELDPKLGNVSNIEDGAFEDCKNIQEVDLRVAEKLKVVPKSCFFGCDRLDKVWLPVSVNRIDSKAFGTGTSQPSLTVRIPGKEVHIVSDAFVPKDGKTIETYKGTSAADYGEYYQPPMRVTYISELHTVRFYVPNLDPAPDIDDEEEEDDEEGNENEDGEDSAGDEAGDSEYKALILVKEQKGIEDGKNATAPKNSEIPKFEGYTFSGWKGSYTDVTEDRIVIGVYTDNSGDASRHKVTFYTYDGSTVVSEQYVNEGGDAVAPMPPERPGYKFVAWVPNTLTNITSDLTVLASYEPDLAGSPRPSGSGNGSNNGDGNGNSSASASPAPTGEPQPTATPDPVRKYTVSVSGGSGSGEYPAGAIVAINAYYLDNQVFDRWTSSTAGVGFANPNATSTTFTMPAANVAVTATYKTGDGTAAANNPAGGGSGTGGSGTGSSNTGNTSTNNGTVVEVTRPGFSNTGVAGATVNGATDNFVIKITEDQAATDAATAALQARYGDLGRILYFPMDISLYDSTGRTKIADTTGITIDLTLPLPDDLVQYAGNNKIAAISGGVLEDLNARFTTVGGVPCINFTATHFSPYVIYVDTANLTEGTAMDSTPKTGDPIHPKWFLSLGMACLALVLFFKRDKVVVKAKTARG